MAKQRTKSFQEIAAQSTRLKEQILAEARRTGWTDELDKRYEKVDRLQERYLDNIRAQKADRIDSAKYYDALYRDRDLAKAGKIAERNGKRQWARSTYMGLSKG